MVHYTHLRGCSDGVISTILAANANILTFFFGLIDVIIFSFTLFDQRIYMLFALHVGYFVPMQFIGFSQWRKRGASTTNATLKARRLKGIQWLWTILSFIGVFGFVMLVRWSLDSGALANLMGWDWLLGAVQEISIKDMALDSTMTTANIVALVLMALAFTDQWYLWVLVNMFYNRLRLRYRMVVRMQAILWPNCSNTFSIFSTALMQYAFGSLSRNESTPDTLIS